MINLMGMTLKQKAQVIAREIIANSKDPFFINLAKKLKNPINALNWVTKSVKYRHEIGDVLYNPRVTLQKGYGDCEDLTLLVGILSYIQGYPVKLRIISNSTNHIFPLVYMDRRWHVVDPTPHTDVELAYVNRHYHIALEGNVGTSGLRLSGTSSNKSESIGQTLLRAMITGLGVFLGARLGRSFVGEKSN